MPRPQPADLWAELNPRQQTYLTATYNADQNAEANQKGGAFDWGQGPPASEWRWQTFALRGLRNIGVGSCACTLRDCCRGGGAQGSPSGSAPDSYL
ncbi:hypothetical protein ACWGQ5_47660 [Streptomyces sp. NPDC055722]